ncbi:hypothetical protein Gohar_004137 [Gossypium harknessii]|uniref:DUF4283 domain-containing protein n=1 Tax=Gossypium harknessii TaxID=34285 RepID=A0A7J9H4M4_9ROSI|nr:hypothetical protein [Gossypium harknessii]
MADVEGNFADLSLEDDEEVVVQLASERLDLGASFENCFVGSFLTSSVVNFQSMRATLANIWHPIGGISISNLNKGIFLFRLYHKMDTDRIKAGGHGESFCPDRILQEKQDFILGWDISLRAPTRHKYVLHDNGSRWYWHDFASFQFPFYLNQLSIHNSDYVDKPSKWIPYRRGSFALYHFALANCSSCS